MPVTSGVLCARQQVTGEGAVIHSLTPMHPVKEEMTL